MKLLELKEEKFFQEKLPVSKYELEPILSVDTIDYHYGQLHKAYVEKANAGIGGDYQIAGAILHNIYFTQLQKPVENNDPHGAVLDLINNNFESFSKMKKDMKDAFMGIQGSGWIYLGKDGKIHIIHNHRLVKDILILIDAFEHSWALDYRSHKDLYFDNMWKIINWTVINSRLSY